MNESVDLALEWWVSRLPRWADFAAVITLWLLIVLSLCVWVIPRLAEAMT